MAKKLSREGHRQRLRDSYIEGGLGSMKEHNVLELILTYAIPRKDVKGTAYELMNHFDNDIGKVLSADVQELCSVSGIGESAATLIKLFADIPERIEENGTKPADVINDYISAKEYVKIHFSPPVKEELILICTNNADEVISCDTLLEGSLYKQDLEPMTLVECAFRHQASSAILVHTKPRNGYNPSEKDTDMLMRASMLLKPLEINFNDYIIVAKNGSLSMSNDIRYVLYFSS